MPLNAWNANTQSSSKHAHRFLGIEQYISLSLPLSLGALQRSAMSSDTSTQSGGFTDVDLRLMGRGVQLESQWSLMF